jgi:hypothetical protein
VLGGPVAGLLDGLGAVETVEPAAEGEKVALKGVCKSGIPFA